MNKIKFTPAQLSEIRRLYMEEGETKAFIAKKFGVSVPVITRRLEETMEILPEEPKEAPVEEKPEEPKPKPKRRIVGVNI